MYFVFQRSLIARAQWLRSPTSSPTYYKVKSRRVPPCTKLKHEFLIETVQQEGKGSQQGLTIVGSADVRHSLSPSDTAPTLRHSTDTVSVTRHTMTHPRRHRARALASTAKTHKCLHDVDDGYLHGPAPVVHGPCRCLCAWNPPCPPHHG